MPRAVAALMTTVIPVLAMMTASFNSSEARTVDLPVAYFIALETLASEATVAPRRAGRRIASSRVIPAIRAGSGAGSMAADAAKGVTDAAEGGGKVVVPVAPRCGEGPPDVHVRVTRRR